MVPSKRVAEPPRRFASMPRPCEKPRYPMRALTPQACSGTNADTLRWPVSRTIMTRATAATSIPPPARNNGTYWARSRPESVLLPATKAVSPARRAQ